MSLVIEPVDHQASPLSITILWSTQSGRAKSCARRTIRFLLRAQNCPTNHRFDIDGKCTFDEYGADRFLSLARSTNDSNGTSNGPFLLLFVSTTGDAEQCTSISQTWSKLLSKALPDSLFRNVRFALFALGDRSYGPDAFCAAGRKLASRLLQLGATPVCRLGYGDDGTPNGGVMADLDVWMEEELLPVLTGNNTHSIISDQHIIRPNISLPVMDQGDESFSVEIVEDHPVATSLTDRESDAGILHEWQMDRYRQHYATYFKKLCPGTAYRYDENIHRVSRTNTNSTGEAQAPLVGHVTANNRITADDWFQNTRHLRIHVTDIMEGDTEFHDKSDIPHALSYQAGDVATILPSNAPSFVSKFLSVLPSSISSIADKTIHINCVNQQVSTCINHPWPTVCTLRGLLTYCADIQALVEREDLFALSTYCNFKHRDGKDQHDKLISLSETSGAALFGDYIIREKRNWVDVFYDFDSLRYEECYEPESSGKANINARLTLSRLLSLLPSITPRHFSIASSPSYIEVNRQLSNPVTIKGFELELCVSVVEGRTPFGRFYAGFCSTYLASIGPNSDVVRLWIRPGSFSKLPLAPLPHENEYPSMQGFFQTPVLLIGAGTGIAPLRSLIFEREAHRLLYFMQTKVADTPLSDAKEQMTNHHDTVLVFGCRKKSKDFYYENEWSTLARNSRLRFIPAFSRDQQQKLYVQRALREADDGLFITKHILEENGAVYIAGGSKMARAVRDEIVSALGKKLHGGDVAAKNMLNRLKRAGLFSIEAWS